MVCAVICFTAWGILCGRSDDCKESGIHRGTPRKGIGREGIFSSISKLVFLLSIIQLLSRGVTISPTKSPG
jgi:hypothetical protein